MKRIISSVLIASMLISAMPAFASEYIVGPYDTLDIQILNHSELAAKAVITPDGQICLPLLGFVEVQGKTLRGLHEFLTEQYSAYLQDPKLTINLTPKPIYIIQHDNKKMDWDVKTAKSIDEAKALMGPERAQASRGIEHGGVYEVPIGKSPDWWEDNWYKVLTATAVVVGVVNVTRKW